ncbi:methyltransferase domain-containing protein [Amycolatopsis benzoatilytica]|uniref:methyltransferase domain-containing protein n=1 Tax=Amycolatopsis benzoatilytica TaxID=346045 RepID=UPI00037719B2|nr:methyltransferase domain-containing protein [Amycolatopsis benzoatilytica]
MPSYSPALTAALAAIDEDAFVRRTDGTLVAQSSSQQIIADLINRLDLQPGMTVLEIGTGTGYSTALLAHLAGAEGHIVSVDVVTELVDRARTLLPAHGYPNTTVLRADGVQGAPEHGPFDRIIAWATAPHLPAAWITQLAFNGVIVAPIALAPISKSGIGTRIRLTDDTTPYIDQLFPAGFVEMHGQELDQWLIPPYGIDVACRDDTGRASWLSSPWLRSPEQYLQGQHLLDNLATKRREISGPLEPGEPAADFRAWLLTTQPDGLTTAALGDPTWRIGHAHPTGAALTDTRTATTMITAGDPDAIDVLLTWTTRWRDTGRPGLADFGANLTAFHDGWTVSAGVD